MNKRSWQFSIRSLLIVTAVVGAFIALAKYYPDIAIVTVVAGLFSLIAIAGPLGLFNFWTSPKRPRFALVTWTAVGTLLLIVTVVLGWTLTLDEITGDVWVWLLIALYGLVSLACFAAAWRFLRSSEKAETEVPVVRRGIGKES